jgi:hypothetical protein
MVQMAKKLHRYQKLALREIASELETAGYVSASGKRYEAAAVARMVAA